MSKWNEMLKLKAMPYGSIYPVSDLELENEVKQIIKDVVDGDCLNDPDIHNKFLSRYREWILETKNNKILGLDLFQGAAFSNGTTEAFDKFYLKHSGKRLRYFKGEYMYHVAIGKHYFKEVVNLDDDAVRENDVVVISFPFANTGTKHNQLDKVLEECTRLNVPVLIDCSYINIAGGLDVDLTAPCVEEVVFSISKCFPLVGHVRIGMRVTKVDNDDPLYVYNKNRYINRLGAAVGLELINRYGPDYNFNRYRDTQLKFCSELGVSPSDTVTFGLSLDKFSEYNRGGLENRLCFSKYLNSGELPQ